MTTIRQIDREQEEALPLKTPWPTPEEVKKAEDEEMKRKKEKR